MEHNQSKLHNQLCHLNQSKQHNQNNQINQINQLDQLNKPMEITPSINRLHQHNNTNNNKKWKPIHKNVQQITTIRVFSIRYLHICNRIIPVVVLLLLLISPGDCLDKAHSANNTSPSVGNTTSGRKSVSKKSDIFYSNNNNYTNICIQEHRIKERDTREEEEMLRQKRRRDKDKKSNWEKSEEAEEKRTVGGCNSCIMREELRTMSLEEIKRDILAKLRLSQAPNITGKISAKLGDYRLTLLLNQFELDRHERNQYTPRRHSHHGYNGIQWVQMPDESVQHIHGMQGDEPLDSEASDRVDKAGDRVHSGVDISNKSNTFRSHGHNGDNKYSDNGQFQEGEVVSDEEDDYHVRTEKIVAFSQPHAKHRHVHHRPTQYFQFSERVRMNRVKRALLWVYIKGRDAPGVVGQNITITVYKILQMGAQGVGGLTESPVITPIISGLVEALPSGTGAWISMAYLQIEKMVQEWFRYPQHNLGLIINATDSAGNNLAVMTHTDSTNVPFLEVYVTDIRKHRTKRTNGLNCNESSNETRCCRYPLTVDFEEFGWDWIIAPKKYEANYCSGECPFVFLTKHPHTHIVQMANPARGGPCCAPRKLSSISMLYFDMNMNIIYGHLPAMVVDRCGCI